MARKIPLQKNSKFKSGEFDKYKPKKYFGDIPIIYRSSYELRFMIICELNSNVIKWSSEQIIIPYLMKEKNKQGKYVMVRHNYHTDFTVFTTNGKKYIIEVKPLTMSPQSEAQIRRSPQIYKNACKWKAALEWAKKHGYEFKVIQEAHLKTRIF